MNKKVKLATALGRGGRARVIEAAKVTLKPVKNLSSGRETSPRREASK
jgi:hypothetical protein